MYKKNYKGRCQKRKLDKCITVCKTYDVIQYAYSEFLQNDTSIKEFKCNVPLDDFPLGDYTTDFICTKTNGDIMVRECVNRDFLLKPLTVKLLDASRDYWIQQGIYDWGIVINADK